MPIANVRGVALNHEIIGTHGPAMALTPGGRNPLGQVRSLAERMAAAGYRVLIHDRRNCGASDVGFDPAQSEFDGQADDLHDLLARYDMLPVIIGGASSGARLSLAFTLRHPVAVRALLLWRVTGGRFAVERLIEKYYEDPDCELNVMTSGTRNIEMADLAEWDAREEAMATLFADFLARKLALRRAG